MNNRKNESLIEEIHNYDIDVSTRTIFLHSQEYGEYGENGVDFKMANKFIKNIHHLNALSPKPIIIKMSSCGGEFVFGMAIYDAIKESKAPVDIYAYGHARSMTSIIFQAARKRYISKYCHFMIHYGEYADYGDMRKVMSGMDFYKLTNRVMFDIYAERCVNGEFFKNMTKENVTIYLEGEVKEKTDVWFTAEEAVYYGFADEIFE